jgi:hypothetical protein
MNGGAWVPMAGTEPCQGLVVVPVIVHDGKELADTRS